MRHGNRAHNLDLVAGEEPGEITIRRSRQRRDVDPKAQRPGGGTQREQRRVRVLDRWPDVTHEPAVRLSGRDGDRHGGIVAPGGDTHVVCVVR